MSTNIIELFPAPPAGVLLVDDRRQLYTATAVLRPGNYPHNRLSLVLNGEPLERPLHLHLSAEMARELQRELQAVINQVEGQA
ncbi:hypothetical protein [Vreelandella sp. EE27]